MDYIKIASPICVKILDKNFLQTSLEEITSNSCKIVISVYKHLKDILNF